MKITIEISESEFDAIDNYVKKRAMFVLAGMGNGTTEDRILARVRDAFKHCVQADGLPCPVKLDDDGL